MLHQYGMDLLQNHQILIVPFTRALIPFDPSIEVLLTLGAFHRAHGGT